MTKRPKRSKKPTTLGVIVALIIAVIAALQSAQKTSAPALTRVASPAASTHVNAPTTVNTTALPITQAPQVTLKPLPTDLPELEITPINGALYEVTGSVNALGCPDTRCKVVDVYKKDSIIVVTGTVMGTIYKTKKTRLWYQVIYHDGSRVYIHGAYVKAHEA